MTLNQQKIVAREFLLFLICIVIGGIAFLAVYPYNSYEHRQVNKINVELAVQTKLADSLSYPCQSKTDRQRTFSRQYFNHFPNKKNFDDANALLWKRLSSLARHDSIGYLWKHTWEPELRLFNAMMGYSTPEAFQHFIKSNMFSLQEWADYKRSLVLQEEIRVRNQENTQRYLRILTPESQWRTAGLAFLLAVGTLFVLRYLWYGIRWSIRVLRQPKT